MGRKKGKEGKKGSREGGKEKRESEGAKNRENKMNEKEGKERRGGERLKKEERIGGKGREWGGSNEYRREREGIGREGWSREGREVRE